MSVTESKKSICMIWYSGKRFLRSWPRIFICLNIFWRRQGMLTLNIKHVKSFLSQSCQNSVQREMAKFEIKKKLIVWRFCDIRRSRVDDKKSTLLIRVAQTLKIRHKDIDQKRKKKISGIRRFCFFDLKPKCSNEKHDLLNFYS